MLKLSNVSHIYPNGTRALDDVTKLSSWVERSIAITQKLDRKTR